VQLDDAIDRLYDVDLDEFVAERGRLAKELRSEGRTEDAAALAKRRKPSVAAWALNQLARRNRRDVDLLLDAGHRLREAQAAMLGGGERADFERARASEAEALQQLMREAERLLEERGSASSSVLQQIGGSLRAAAISEEGRELVARGRFVQAISTSGFDVVGRLAEAAAPTGRPTPSRSQRQRRQEEEARVKEALREARDRLRAAERDARAAEREAERLRAAADDAAAVADEARAAAHRAAKDVEEAKTRLADARRP
jgi:hypothetical protein